MPHLRCPFAGATITALSLFATAGTAIISIEVIIIPIIILFIINFIVVTSHQFVFHSEIGISVSGEETTVSFIGISLTFKFSFPFAFSLTVSFL